MKWAAIIAVLALTACTDPPPTRFKTGDVIQMNSGGPKLTVKNAFPSGDVEAVWFDQQGVLHDREVEQDEFHKVTK